MANHCLEQLNIFKFLDNLGQKSIFLLHLSAQDAHWVSVSWSQRTLKHNLHMEVSSSIPTHWGDSWHFWLTDSTGWPWILAATNPVTHCKQIPAKPLSCLAGTSFPPTRCEQVEVDFKPNQAPKSTQSTHSSYQTWMGPLLKMLGML